MSPHNVHVFINKTKYELESPEQTGASLKHLAGIPLGDVLFLQRPGDDEVVANDATVTLSNGDHLHSQPPADYGLEPSLLVEAGLDPERVVVSEQPGGWSFLVILDHELPEGYQPPRIRLLIKLPPLFPEAAPDMFWANPAVLTHAGTLPRGSSTEMLLGEEWQRFSWHLAPGAWKPGMSTLRDYLRCVRARFLRKD
jgi:hypothetical protein